MSDSDVTDLLNQLEKAHAEIERLRKETANLLACANCREAQAAAEQRIAQLEEALAEACAATGTTQHVNSSECVAQIKNTLAKLQQRIAKLEAALREINEAARLGRIANDSQHEALLSIEGIVRGALFARLERNGEAANE